MSRKKISTTVYIEPDQNEKLHTLHGRTKVPVAVYIREGIDLVLKKYEHMLPGQMSLVEPAAARPRRQADTERKPAVEERRSGPAEAEKPA
ncbi:MAG: ribbon-helix-helix domain-containing protein [Polyangiaceae bacterium]|nr:ribbon-helix-helix domain-containing protein [Polyangiaceae bacterium]